MKVTELQTITTQVLDLVVALLHTVGQGTAAHIAGDARPAVQEAVTALAGGPVDYATVTSSILHTVGTALAAAGLQAAAGWPALLAPAVHAWVAQLVDRPLVGSRLDGVADLT